MAKKFIPSDHLSDDINLRIMQSERDGGIWLKDIKVNDTLKMVTQNTTYTIKKTADDDYLISGHPKRCPTPVHAFIQGSTWGSSMIRTEFIGIGMHLEVFIADKLTLTSQIKSAEIIQ